MATGPSVSDMLVSQTELGKILGRSTRWLRELSKQGVLPRDERTSEYPLGRSVAAFVNHVEKKANVTEEGLDYHRERARLTKAQADRAEDRRDRERRRLIPEAAVRRALEDILVPLRQELLSLEVTLPPRVRTVDTAAEVRAIVAKEVRSILERVSKPEVRFVEGDDPADLEEDDALSVDDP